MGNMEGIFTKGTNLCIIYQSTPGILLEYDMFQKGQFF